MTMNTIVAVVSDEPVEPGTSFAAATHAAQSRKPHRIIIAVRIGFSLASAMLPVNCSRRGISMRGLMLSLGLVATMSAWGSPAPPLPPPRDLQLARDMLKSLVEINTTHAHGSTEAAKAIQGWLSSAGFAAGDVVFLAPSDHPTKGNVVVRYRGKHSSDGVLLLGDLAVVEAKPE